jgi:hypothetical protein
MTLANQPHDFAVPLSAPAGGVLGEQSAESNRTRQYASAESSDATKGGHTVCDDGGGVLCAPLEQAASLPPATSSGKKRGGSGGVAVRPRDRVAEREARKVRYSLALPQCGAAVESITRRVKSFRRALEAAVIDARGGISLTDACAISTACAAERHLSLCAAWLKRDADKLTPSERLQHSKGMLEGSEKRDRAVQSLKLPGGASEAAGGNPADLYARLAKDVEQAATPGEPTSAAATPETPDGPAPRPLAPLPAALREPHSQTVPLEDL